MMLNSKTDPQQNVPNVALTSNHCHILQCLDPDAQLLLDTAIIQQWKQLLDSNMELGLLNNLSTGLDLWHFQEALPPSLTSTGQAQALVTWENLAPRFISPTWKQSQVNYYLLTKDLTSTTNCTSDLMQTTSKLTYQQDGTTKTQILHKLWPDQVKDQELNIKK